MKISFPSKSTYDSLAMSVRFPAIIDGITKGALVSLEALQDHFGANTNSDLVAIFESNRRAIENKVRAPLAINSEMELIIKTNMF